MAAREMHIPEIVTTDVSSDNNDGNRPTSDNREDTQDASSGSNSIPHTHGSNNSNNLNPGVVVEDKSLNQHHPTTSSERERDRPPTPHIEIQSTPPVPVSPSLSPSPSHSRSPSTAGATDPNYLTPILKVPPRPTLEVPSTLSPGGFGPHSASSDTSSQFPPSPTLSTRSSVHFQPPTTLALRDNVVDGRSGMDSLTLLRGHERKISSAGTEGSFVLSESGDTDPDPHSPQPPPSANGESREHGVTKGRSFSIGTTATTAMSLGARSDGATISPTITHVDDASTVHHHKGRQKPTKKPTNSTENDVAPVEHLNPDLDTTDPAPFTFKPLHLASLVDPKSVEVLQKMGGVDAVLQSLGTDPIKGLPSSAFGGSPSEKSEKGGVEHEATLEDRKRVYGTNIVPTRKSKSLLLLMWLALKDKILIMLSIAAAVSLALGLFQDFGTKPETVSCAGPNGTVVQCELPKVDWVEGVAIIIAIIIVDVVGSVNDWQKERQFRALNERKEDRTLKVIRAGKETVINVKDVLVGDICILEPGEIIPVDGIFLRGHAVKCDESGATGESDSIKKIPYSTMIERGDDVHEHEDCFLVSGSKVQEGVGEYVAIAVGTRSFNGRIMMALRGDAEETPLQGKLNYVAEMIARLGTAAGIILFASLMIRFFVQLKTEADRTASEKALAFVNILVISFTIVVVAVPEGLPLAVTLALAFATKRMTGENLLVRVLASCETMANASVVCTDKTGTLTQNEMSVVAGSLGIHAKFVRRLKDNLARTNADGKGEGGGKEERARKHRNDFSIDQADLNRILPPALKKLFNESIALNSTAFEDKDPITGKLEFVGSKTETALLTFARELEWENYQVARDSAEVVQMIPFSSERKSMGIVVRLGEKRWRVYLKGASEILTKRCTRHVVVKEEATQSSSEADEIETKKIDKLGEENISRTIIFYANQMLRTIALCYRDLDEYPSFGEEMPYDELARDMTLIAITGIEDPLRDGVREAVDNCHRAGVAVKMCTGDNVLTARSIASQCGIFTPGGIVMEGPVFRTLDDHDMKEILPRLQVLARSSPEDKKRLVEQLKEMGEIVGVTGDGTNDGPALKSAHVGFSMGIAGTEIAKEASDIILMDDNFASIVSAIMWGRCVNDAVRKFLQFQISVNITAVLITYITAVASTKEQSVLSAVQLLWINIIMDTFAALALATDPASPALLERKPARKTAPLFNVDMCKQIAGQATYQTIIVLVFHFLGPRIFHEATGTLTDLEKLNQDTALQAFVFNAFVFCQIFNSINCRRLDNKLNVFEGIFRNYYFLIITALEIAIQILVIFFGNSAFQVKPISGTQWGVSVAIGFVSLPLGAALRRIPNKPVERFLVKIKFMSDPTVLPITDPARVTGDWNSAIDTVRDNLNTFAHVRGGRMRSSSIVRRSRLSRPKDVALPSLMTMVPTIVATSVAGRWGQGSLSDPAHVDPSVSSAALWEGKIQFHPETAKDDPAFKRWGGESSV